LSSSCSTWFWALLVLALSLFIAQPVIGEEPYPVSWIRQFGAAEHDQGWGVGVSQSGDVYVAASTFETSLFGQAEGDFDAVLINLDKQGNVQWARQFGTPSSDEALAVAVESSGAVVVAGRSAGSLGASNSGGSDVILARYDRDGQQIWLSQFGTSHNEIPVAVAIDPMGFAWTAGTVNKPLTMGDDEAMLVKWSGNGDVVIVREWGTPNTDRAESIAVDSIGNIYVAGDTLGDLAGSHGMWDAFGTKVDADGNQLWTHQFGTTDADGARAVAADADGNVYIAGLTRSVTGGDAFLAKISAVGTLLWSRTIGTNREVAEGLAVDGMGSVFMVGRTSERLGADSFGGTDTFVSKFDSAGQLLWTQQFGSSENDIPNSLSTDIAGNLYITGQTNGSMSDTNAGHFDVFVTKLTAHVQIPEPASGHVICVALMAASITRLGRRRRRL
jgi:hypothetical protein